MTTLPLGMFIGEADNARIIHSFKCIAGKLADLFGRKPVLVVLTLLFLIGSYGCGISQSLYQIIVARAIAGFGGGGVTLLANVIIHDVISIDKRSQYQSFISMVQTVMYYTDREGCVVSLTATHAISLALQLDLLLVDSLLTHLDGDIVSS